MKKILLSGLMLLILFLNKGWTQDTKDLVFSSELPAAYHKYDFDKPSDVFIDAAGDMYVANTGKKCVQRFNQKGELEQEFYGKDEDMLAQPIGVAVDSKRNVFVIDAALKCVLGFNKDGDVISVWGKGNIGKPCGMTVGMINGNDRVYVTDTDNHCVWEFDGKTMGVRRIGAMGTGSGQFMSPTDIAFNPDDFMLYVVDTGNHRIQKIDTVATTPGISVYFTKDNLESLGTLTGITTNRNQYIYIAAKKENINGKYQSIYGFDRNGIKKGEFGGKAGFGEGQFGDISGLFVNKDGLVYVVDRDNNCIQRFDSTGEFEALYSSCS
ncbi:MAG: NHL repeat-containing protein, partial [Candidatus Desantisbacteria bacterium]